MHTTPQKRSRTQNIAPAKSATPKTRDGQKLDIREACVVEALRIISQSGIEALSLREVARRLGVSHQAPYKHFRSREHILAEVVGRAFADFARHLEEAVGDDDPVPALATIGRAYLEYALRHPLQYRLMFGTPLPDLAAYPDLAEKAGKAFSLLKSAIHAVQKDASESELMMEALFAWSTVHGLASITQTGSFSMLGIHGMERQAEAIRHIMTHICRAVTGPDPV